jgi:hypothetical protein
MFLWCIINHTTAKSNARITNIVRRINNLRALMIEKDSNVQAFNTAVQHLLNSYFSNKREPVDQATTNLFDAFTTCKDTEFVDYIKRQKHAYIDHTAVITPETMMDYALKQYQTMLQENMWGVESSD